MSQWPLYILIWLLLPCGVRHSGYQCACVTRDYKSYMSLCGNLYTHIYFSLIKRSLVTGVAEWKLAFSVIPYCKRKHTKCEEFPKCCSHLPTFWYSTVLCLSVVLAWKVSGTSNSVCKHGSLYPWSQVWLWSRALLNSWLPFLFLFLLDSLDLLWGMLQRGWVQGLVL